MPGVHSQQGLPDLRSRKGFLIIGTRCTQIFNNEKTRKGVARIDRPQPARTLHGLYTTLQTYTDLPVIWTLQTTDFGLQTTDGNTDEHDDRSDGSPCAKVGLLSRRRYGAPAYRWRETVFSYLEKSKVQKKISKMRKAFKASNLRIWFLKIFHKTRFWVIVARKFYSSRNMRS